MAAALSIDSAEPSTPGADVGHVGQLEQALHRAVLAVRAVEEREHDHRDVRVDGRGCSVGRGSTAVPVALSRSGHGLRSLAERGQGVVGLQPLARPGDADGEGVVAVVVDGPQHVGGGRAAHLVLGRPAPEQHDEPDAVGERHGGGV